jgi:hypothetical protein
MLERVAAADQVCPEITMVGGIGLGQEAQAVGGRGPGPLVPIGGIDADAARARALDQADQEVALAAADLQDRLARQAMPPVQVVYEFVDEAHEARRVGLSLLVGGGIGRGIRHEPSVLDEAAGRTAGELEITLGEGQRRGFGLDQQAAVHRNVVDRIERPGADGTASPAAGAHPVSDRGIVDRSWAPRAKGRRAFGKVAAAAGARGHEAAPRRLTAASCFASSAR